MKFVLVLTLSHSAIQTFPALYLKIYKFLPHMIRNVIPIPAKTYEVEPRIYHPLHPNNAREKSQGCSFFMTKSYLKVENKPHIKECFYTFIILL